MRRYRIMDDTVRPQARATLAPHGPHRLLLPSFPGACSSTAVRVANWRGGWGDRAGGKAVGREHVYRTNQRQTGQQATGKVIIKREEVPGGRAEIHWECTGAPTVVPLCTCVIDYSEVR